MATGTNPGELPEGDELPEGTELSEGGELGEGGELPRRARPASAISGASSMSLTTVITSATGTTVLDIARKHLGEPYILGARAPMANANWAGPWDCAEFASWCVYRASGILFGTEPQNDPMLADAYTGYWYEQARASGSLIDWRDAANIVGAAVLRRPAIGQIGHIVLSDGQGGTVEAHSRQRGVIAGTLSGRRWDCGILVSGIRTLRSDRPVSVAPADPGILRLTTPLMQGDRVLEVQKRLAALGSPVGAPDGIYGPQTAHAVRLFQASKGLLADGEVGPTTRKALGLDAG